MQVVAARAAVGAAKVQRPAGAAAKLPILVSCPMCAGCPGIVCINFPAMSAAPALLSATRACPAPPKPSQAGARRLAASIAPRSPAVSTRQQQRAQRRSARRAADRPVQAAAAAAAAPGGATSSASDAEADVLMPSPFQRKGHHPALEAVNNSTKWAVSAAAFCTLLMRRDLVAAWCVLGSIVAAVNCRVSPP